MINTKQSTEIIPMETTRSKQQTAGTLVSWWLLLKRTSIEVWQDY